MPAYESDRSQAILDFLVGDLVDPPSKASLVTFMANAYKAVATLQRADEPLDSWLAGERGWSGIRERATIVAVLSSSSINKAELTESYCAEHPAHAVELGRLLEHLQQ